MEIKLLSEETISRISAGEVIERPLNVVKELVENAIDAGSTAVTVEIRDGGISMIRVTDNGCGIERDQIARAFVRHATSKIRDAEDLSRLSSLGFRGEALASIAAVAQVEMITKVREAVSGTRAVNDHLASYSPDAPVKISLEEIGAPDGTTVIVRNLFGSIPVRRKFLRQPQTEAGYITDLIEKQALSHPNVSIHYRVNGQEKLHTSGNGSLRELIYRIYGRETAGAILPVHAELADQGLRLYGFIGRPEVSRSSRSFETFFINGRMLQSKELSAGLEEGYRTDLMQHRFPFAVLHLTMPPEDIDVNVHPSKMEVRFRDRAAVMRFLDESVHAVLASVELIPKAGVLTAKEERALKKKEARMKAERLQEAPRYEAFESARRPGMESPGPAAAAGFRGAVGTGTASQTGTAVPPAAGESAGTAVPTVLVQTPASASAGQKLPDAGGEGFVDEGFVFEDRRAFGGNKKTAEPPGPGPAFSSASPVQAAPEEETAAVDPSVSVAAVLSHDVTGFPGPEEGHHPIVDSTGSIDRDHIDVDQNDLPESVRPVDLTGQQLRQTLTADQNGHTRDFPRQPQNDSNDHCDHHGYRTAGMPRVPGPVSGQDHENHESLPAWASFDQETKAPGTWTQESLLTPEAAARYKLIGQVFGTYWIIEFENRLLLIDQHAAHEKVNYERLMHRVMREHPGLDTEGIPREAVPEEFLVIDRALEPVRKAGDRSGEDPAGAPVLVASQQVLPPIVLRLSGREEEAYLQYRTTFAMMGYEIEEFGGGSYAIRAVPTELFGQTPDSLLRETLEEIMNDRISGTPRAILSKVASMSCKAAVKGSRRLSAAEAKALIDELLTLENPYHCPHGRPTMIVMSQYELDRKFKRIV